MRFSIGPFSFCELVFGTACAKLRELCRFLLRFVDVDGGERVAFVLSKVDSGLMYLWFRSRKDYEIGACMYSFGQGCLMV